MGAFAYTNDGPELRSSGPSLEEESLVYLPGLAGAEAGGVLTLSSTECVPPPECAISMVKEIEVHMKRIAAQVVIRVSTLAAARGPNAVCEPCPPKAPARSAERPCCKRTTKIRTPHTITCRIVTRTSAICIFKLLSRSVRCPGRKSFGAEEGT